MSEFQPSNFSQPLPTMGNWERAASPAQQDMEALRRSASRLLRGVLLLAFAALTAAYVWYAWLH